MLLLMKIVLFAMPRIFPQFSQNFSTRFYGQCRKKLDLTFRTDPALYRIAVIRALLGIDRQSVNKHLTFFIFISTQERNYSHVFTILDQCMMTIFVCEILTKWYHGFLKFWKVGWNILDFFIVSALLFGPCKSSFFICLFLFMQNRNRWVK